MGAIGIVAEYNPFHTGHARQLARTRELLGAELKAFSEDPEFRNITVVVNVDPQ